MITNIFIFFIVLGMLIFFHELGHFLAAKFFGIGVEKFSLGFGPRIFGYRKGITDYCVSAIPLGGYVKMVGQDPDSEIDDTMLSYSFLHKHVLKKILVVFAGPAFNIFLAIILFFIIFVTSGVFILKPVIGDVICDMPASRVGIKSGDVIKSIDEKLIASWDDISKSISDADGSGITVCFSRSGVYSTVEIIPSFVNAKNIFGQEVGRYAIGVTPEGSVSTKSLNFLDAARESLIKTYDVIYLTGLSIIKLIQGSVSAKTMGGPIMIAEMAGQHARVGITNLMFFVALLSVNLAVLNCLPIPILDGGHLVFFSVEAIIGRPVNTRFKELAHQAGGLLLLLLMIYVFYNDVARLFSD